MHSSKNNKKPSQGEIESLFKWKKVHAKIVSAKGDVIFEMKNVEAPEHWSQTAIEIAASKYFYKPYEKSVRQLVHRICNGLNTSLKPYVNDSKQRARILNHIKYLIYSQTAAFNSPVWFNCGVFETYGVRTQSHHYAYDYKTKSIEKTKYAYEKPQLSACFIQSVEDSLDSMYDLLKKEAILFKYGSGTGTNFSKIRSKYEKLNTGGYSSGLISFLEVFDKSAGSIKSGGVTRRAAKMVCLDIDHPEIIEFVNWKKNEEEKAKALIKNGYSADLDGEVYKTISGQNSNNSIRIPDQFMRALVQKKQWNLKFTNKKGTYKKVPAEQIWNQICQAAWTCADPGVQFDTTINKFHTCPQSGKINSSNPCSEFMFLDNTACNLASINLVKFYVQKENQFVFDFEKFLETVDVLFRVQESLVDYSSYPSLEIAQNSHDYRPLGLGYANLGSLLMLMGLPYESEEGRAWAALITSVMTAQSYLTSALIAKDKKTFNGYNKNKSSVFNVIQGHARSGKKIQWNLLPSDCKKINDFLWQKTIIHVKKYGVRNAQATVIAPTGTIGLVMDCDTTGIEPEYALVKNKKLSGGGSFQFINQSVFKSLEKLNYSSKEIENIQIYLEKNKTLVGCSVLKPEHLSVFQTAFGENSISPEGHIHMMAAVQPFISGAISKTVNLPANATPEKISEIYLQAWKMKLKSVAIYRDHSKFVQPLNVTEKKLDSDVLCLICQGPTQLESGCFKCLNCGYTSTCVG